MSESDETGARRPIADGNRRGQADALDRNPVQITGSVRLSIHLIAFCLVFIVIYFARSLFLPIVLALLLSLTLSPIVRFARRRNIPAGLTSALLTSSLFIVFCGALLGLAQPVTNWVSDAPSISSQLEFKFRSLRSPVQAVVEAEREVEELTDTDDPDVQKVVVKQPGLMNRAADDLATIGATLILTFTLATFLLAYSGMLYDKVLKTLPKISDKKRALSILYAIEKVVSQYLLTVSSINIGLGFSVGLVMWLLGMPTPYLWGIAAALLNFLPYIGSVLGIIMVGVVAIISFDNLSYALLVPTSYLVLTFIEGQFVTPAVLGRRLELNPVAIFLSIIVWGFMWGVVGILIAVPLLVVAKSIFDGVWPSGHVSQFLTHSQTVDREEEIEAQKTQ